MRHSISLPITDPSQVGEARRTTSRLTDEIALPEHERGVVAIIVTELGNNLAKYAQHGQLVIRVVSENSKMGLEILSLDSGPGIGDAARCIEDGFSSGGTPGNGLGAIKRMSTEFAMYSVPGIGTAIMSRVLIPDAVPISRTPLVAIGAVCVPIHGEEKCGDAWAVHQDSSRAVLMVVDGLGHGAIAAEAADEGVAVLEEHKSESATNIVNYAHLALRSTRGAVIGVAETDRQGNLSFCGIGNITACIIDGGRHQHLISLNGTIGLAAKPRAFAYTWPNSSVLIMSSDGLQTRWQLERFPGLLQQHPSLIAGVLYQHYTRGRDDVSVLVARWE